MYSWSENQRYWMPMVHGSPVRSKYFWTAVFLSVFSLAGMAKVAWKLLGNHELALVLGPPLLIVLALMGAAGSRAIEVIRRVRAEEDRADADARDRLSRMAFDFFFMYLCFTAASAASMWLLVAALY
jgi:hypothetical protein